MAKYLRSHPPDGHLQEDNPMVRLSEDVTSKAQITAESLAKIVTLAGGVVKIKAVDVRLKQSEKPSAKKAANIAAKAVGSIIFKEIQGLYVKKGENFQAKVSEYFRKNFFEDQGVKLSQKEKGKFESILNKAAQKFKAERATESKSKRVAKAIGRFVMDCSTLGLSRLYRSKKNKSAEDQIKGLVKYSEELVNKNGRPRTREESALSREESYTQARGSLSKVDRIFRRLFPKHEARHQTTNQASLRRGSLRKGSSPGRGSPS